MNMIRLDKHPLLRQCYDVMQAIEVCGASKELTHAVTLAGDLLHAINALCDERDALKAAIATAYGHLWHVNNEPHAPIPLYTPEKAAYAARKVLRDLLTSEQRGDAINATQYVWGSSADVAKGE